MIRPAAKHSLEVVAGLMSVLVIGGTVLAAKLASGPVSLKFLAPTVAAVLSGDLGDYRVDVGDAVVRWSKVHHGVEFRVLDVDFFDRSGARVARIPDMDIGMQMIGWNHGVVTPTSISLDHASAIIERDVKGAFSIGTSANGGEGSLLPVVLSHLLNGGKTAGLSYLSQLSIKDADLTLIDHRTGATIHAPQSRLLFQRADHGFSAHLEAPAQIANEHFAFSLDGEFDGAAQKGVIDAKFTPVRLSHLAPISDFYKPLAPFDVAVGGTAHLVLGANAVITRAALSLTSTGEGSYIPSPGAAPVAVQSASFSGTYLPNDGIVAISGLKFEASGNHADVKGQVNLKFVEGSRLQVTGLDIALAANDVGIAWPSRFPQPINIDSASIKANVDLGHSWQVDLASAALSLGGAKVELAGSIVQGDGSPAIKLNGQLTNFQVGDLNRYWPLGVGQRGREWVTAHVHSGLVTKGVLKVDAPAGALAADPVDDGVMRFDFHIDNGVAEYVLGMPPLTNVSADMVLTPNTFGLDLHRANILNAEVTAGSVRIAQFGRGGPPIDIKAQGSGDITEMLGVINAPPLAVLDKYGMKPQNMSGKASIDLAMTVPQYLRAPGAVITYQVAAKGQDVKLAGLIGNVALDHGTLDLKVDYASGIEGHGSFALDGAPTDIVWHERFHDRAGKPTEFDVKTTLDDEARASLGLDSGSYLMGPVSVDMVARGAGRKIASLDGTLDFTGSTIDFGPSTWSKPAGAAASAAFKIQIADGGAISVKSVSATGRGVDIDGRAELASDGRLMAVDFPKLKLDGFSDVTLKIDRQRAEGLIAKVDGRFLNLEPFLKQALEQSSEIGTVPWQIDANLDAATLREGVETRDLKASIASSGSRLLLADAKGEFPASGDFSASLSDAGDGARLLVVSSSDAGKFVKGITGIESLLGGHLSLSVQLAAENGTAPGSGPAAPTPPPTDVATAAPPPAPQAAVTGKLKIDDFKVVNAPILARLLTVGSLQGISDLLNGQGIEFTHLDMPFWMDKGRLGIEDGRAAGPAIGLTLQGIVDRHRKVTDLNGTIVPAYTLNSALGNVPVLGQLLVSKPGEGIFGFTYNVAGDVNEPRVTVNPLSALAPGFLRRLFQLGESQAGELRAPSPTDQ